MGHVSALDLLAGPKTGPLSCGKFKLAHLPALSFCTPEVGESSSADVGFELPTFGEIVGWTSPGPKQRHDGACLLRYRNGTLERACYFADRP